VNQDQIWTAVQDELRFQLAKPSYETWLKNTTLLSADGSIYRVGVPSKLAKDWLEDRFAGLIQETLQAVTGTEVEVDFVVSSNGNRAALAGDDDLLVGEDNMPEPSPAVGQSELSEKFKFSSFVVGNNSRFAHAAAKAVADAPGETYNPLFLYGGVGLGKTHLMHAIGHEVRRRFPKKRVLYLTSEQFMNEVIASIQTARMSEFRVTYRTVDVLLIDDIQFLAGKDRTKEEFFHTFNALHEINKQIVISSDRPPKEIPTLEDRLRSRFEQGLLADIQPPDFETRLAILRSKLSANANLVSEAVLTFIAHKVQKNIRELEGALTRVLAFSAIHQRPVDEEEAARLLEDIIPAGNRRPLTIDRIQETVAEYYSVSVEDMKSKRRDKHIVFPRQVAMYVVREETPSSLPVIGQAFGGRDHTTALHSIEKIINELKEDERLRYEVQSIREQLYAAR
jgi:chromosomal replication initiator protein